MDRRVFFDTELFTLNKNFEEVQNVVLEVKTGL